MVLAARHNQVKVGDGLDGGDRAVVRAPVALRGGTSLRSRHCINTRALQVLTSRQRCTARASGPASKHRSCIQNDISIHRMQALQSSGLQMDGLEAPRQPTGKAGTKQSRAGAAAAHHLHEGLAARLRPADVDALAHVPNPHVAAGIPHRHKRALRARGDGADKVAVQVRSPHAGDQPAGGGDEPHAHVAVATGRQQQQPVVLPADLRATTQVDIADETPMPNEICGQSHCRWNP